MGFAETREKETEIGFQCVERFLPVIRVLARIPE